MMTVNITGWNEGFQKVRFTQLLQREFGYSLREAKTRTDAVMDDVVVELSLQGDVERVLQAMAELGAKVEVVMPVGA